MRQKLGSATITLATNLYSKDTRFVYELIQNAEDNQYSAAEMAGEELYLRFNMYPDRIVLESNEDGFNLSDVNAICNIGKSTKTVAEGYIGEKGIGFKSVFKVAKKVYLQSGPFAFSFEYTRDSKDDGLGMVTPMDEEHVELPEGVKTRITLILLDPSMFETIVRDLVDIPDTLLIFLSKLEALHINVFPPNASAIVSKITRTTDGENIATITKTRTVDGLLAEDTHRFHVVKRKAKNLPRDGARLHTDGATVVLAFPVDDEDIPIIEQQHVFAFLPLRKAGFTFLIQTDFITQASREDVFHSDRNKALLSTVAETFRDAVSYFYTHATLRYQWMRYLPTDTVSDEFWTTLRPKIISLLETTACLESRGSHSYLPSRLQYLNKSYKDKNRKPLFADTSPESYLSSHYTLSDYKTLKSIGTNTLNYATFICTAEADLKNDSSRMKAENADEDWHDRVAAKLHRALIAHNKENTRSIRRLEMIPLCDGSWVSAEDGPISFPGLGNSSIPRDLDFKLVESTATANPSRKALFTALGIRILSTKAVVSRITEIYSTSVLDLQDPACCERNKTHLQYLYWNLPEEATEIDKNVFLVDEYSRVQTRDTHRSQHIYFIDKEDKFGAWNMLHPSIFFGKSVHVFLHGSYLSKVPPETTNNGRTWKEWLGEFAGVHNYPQILKLGTLNVLSDEFEFIISKQPGKLVGLLMHNWSFYEPQIRRDVLTKLSLCKVPSDGSLAANLGETFLPLPRLKLIVLKLKIKTFPFLILHKEITDDIDNDWRFLKCFGVKGFLNTDDILFYTTALRRIILENREFCSPGVSDAIFTIYSAIERSCADTENASRISKLFKLRRIYIPETSQWISSASCVWRAPPWLQSRRPLERIPEFADRQHLFKVILKIKDADWNDYLADLKILKAEQSFATETIMDIYEHLWREFEHDSSGEVLRKIFEESELVFMPANKTWHPPSACIWAEDTIQMPGKVSIQTFYDNLIDFFCRNLSVPKPDLTMHVQALEDLSNLRPPPTSSQLKNMIKLISSMGPTAEDVARLRSANIFSVSTAAGSTRFVSTTSEWAIVDRSEYGTVFAGKLSMLDYSIEEVRACSKFLLALDLGRRHLSELVEEKTNVQDGSFDKRLSQLLRTKAYALFRCAVHFQSQKSKQNDMSLYNQLLGVSVNVSRGISKSISVLQSGKLATVENSRAQFHLEERNGDLHLYIPRDGDAREECYFRQLPRSMMSFLGISDPIAEALLTGIIGCQSLVPVDGILKDAGIVEVDGITRPLVAIITNDTTATEESLPKKVIDAGHYKALEPSTPESITDQDQSPSAAFKSESQYGGSWNPVANRHLFTPPREHDESESDSEDDTPSPYINLLERVIDTASSISIPQNGRNAFAEDQGYFLPRIVLPGSGFGPRCPERDRKIGAAGELLVFEILSELDLPGFGIDNWKSTIRKEVRVHKKYSDLEPWSGRETADITYKDTDGELTQLLIKRGYLDEDFADSRSLYYLEVKTTSSDCDEQFYMSKAQYKRMKKMKLSTEETEPAGIYVIFRVFDIGGKIGFRVFVDPEYHRKNGELLFTAENWAVKPVDI